MLFFFVARLRFVAFGRYLEPLVLLGCHIIILSVPITGILVSILVSATTLSSCKTFWGLEWKRRDGVCTWNWKISTIGQRLSWPITEQFRFSVLWQDPAMGRLLTKFTKTKTKKKKKKLNVLLVLGLVCAPTITPRSWENWRFDIVSRWKISPGGNPFVEIERGWSNLTPSGTTLAIRIMNREGR